ncbi:MAG: hypothetical protein ACE5MI_06295 [Acidimicrobiia bacterium]
MPWRHRSDAGFSIIESTVALVVVFVVLLALLRSLDAGLRIVVETRRQAAASALASELLERARSLEWDNIGLTDDSNDADCPPAGDGVGCATWTADPYSLTIATDTDGDYTFEGEKVVFLNPASTFDPFLSFHSSVTRDNQDFERFLFVSSVVDGGGSERFRRVTAVVQWTAHSGFRKEVRQVTYASAFDEPAQPFLYGSVDYDGGFVTVSGTQPQGRGMVEGTSDWSDPSDARPDLIATVEFPDAQVDAVTDYVSGAFSLVQGTVGDYDWSDGKTATIGREVAAKRADDDFGSAPPLNDPPTITSLAAWEVDEPAPHDYWTREETDDGCCADAVTFNGQAWSQYTTDDLPYAVLDVSSAEAVIGSFTTHDGLGSAVADTYYLKGDGVPQATLSTTAPTATVLPNYDPGRDSDPGLLLKKSSLGLAETDPTKYQLWGTAPGAVTVDGPANLVFWSAMKDFEDDKEATVAAALLDCVTPGVSCVTVATGTVTADPWSGGSSTWVEHTLDFGTVSYTVAAGRVLAVKVVVDDTPADDDMWFAYDTVDYQSRLNINTSSLIGAPYEFRLFTQGAASGSAHHYQGTIDRYKTVPTARRVDVSFSWDGETVYFGHDEVYEGASGGAFLGWIRVDLPSLSGTLSAGEVTSAPSLLSDHLTIWAWDPSSDSYTQVFDVDYDTLASVQTISVTQSHLLTTAGYPQLSYDLQTDLTVNPPIISEAFDPTGSRSNVIVQAPAIVAGTIAYRVEDMVPILGTDGLLFDLELVFGLGGFDGNAQYIDPEA